MAEKYELHYKTKQKAVRKIEDTNITSFNRKLQSKSDHQKIRMTTAGTTVDVDLITGEIKVNDEPIDLDLDFDPKKYKLRWVNFKKHYVSYKMSFSMKANHVLNVVGWQTNVKGKNVQRLVAVSTESGKWALWVKYDKGIPTRKKLNLSHQLMPQDLY